jgi:uncharacterized protein with HEPN domain
MKTHRNYTDYLRDILEYAEKAERFVEGLDFQAFERNEGEDSCGDPST